MENHNPIRAKEDFLVFGKPDIQEPEIREVVDSLKSGWLGTGPKVAKFEEMVRSYKDCQHAIAVNSCTAAIHLACLASGIGPGDEVITTAMTFCATINAIIHSGATPVLADIDEATMNIDPQKIREKITPRTKAVLIVHFAGRPCNMDEICKITEEQKLILIEDCAHAIEAEYHGKRVGTFGDFGCFSFYVTKNVTTGEGGMVITGKDHYAEKIKILALHGMSKDAWHRFGDEGFKHYHVVDCGYKYNMMDIQAAIGLHQIQRVELNWKRRQQIWSQYQQVFKNLPVTLPQEPEDNTRHAYHLYPVLLDKNVAKIARDDFLTSITKENIGVGVHYLSIAEHPYYQERFNWQPEDYPAAQKIGQQTVSLPLAPNLSEMDVSDVVITVNKLLNAS